jgi:hypothetical protein
MERNVFLEKLEQEKERQQKVIKILPTIHLIILSHGMNADARIG